MLNRRLGLFALLCFALAVAACSSHSDKPHDSGPPNYIIYSPNGEPLNGGTLGKPTCEKAMSDWFDRISAGGQGITKAAFINDAQTQFRRFDIDHNGYIVSEELDRFREPYRQQPPAEEKPEKESKHSGKGKSAESASNVDPTLTASDPVMSADANLDFKVTPDEFTKHAQDNFIRFDTSKNGLLDRGEITAVCLHTKTK